MIYGSVCSGIEAASVAWHGINATMCMSCEGLGRYNGRECGACDGRGFTDGRKGAWYSEIEKFPSAVLKHHYPMTPNLGDMTLFKEWHDEPTKGTGAIELLVGGTPCQSFSIAGLRKGLAGFKARRLRQGRAADGRHPASQPILRSTDEHHQKMPRPRI